MAITGDGRKRRHATRSGCTQCGMYTNVLSTPCRRTGPGPYIVSQARPHGHPPDEHGAAGRHPGDPHHARCHERRRPTRRRRTAGGGTLGQAARSGRRHRPSGVRGGRGLPGGGRRTSSAGIRLPDDAITAVGSPDELGSDPRRRRTGRTRSDRRLVTATPSARRDHPVGRAERPPPGSRCSKSAAVT